MTPPERNDIPKLIAAAAVALILIAVLAYWLG
jgi:hypothetical protein